MKLLGLHFCISFARFDGHGGPEAAELAATTMHTHLAKALAAGDHADTAHWCE
jgi:serine/threonine protein phosphatase PrpC